MRVHLPQGGGGVAAFFRHRPERELFGEHGAYLRGGNSAFTGPPVIGVQGHLLNKPQLVAAR